MVRVQAILVRIWLVEDVETTVEDSYATLELLVWTPRLAPRIIDIYGSQTLLAKSQRLVCPGYTELAQEGVIWHM
jgi:hypothetical protein